MKFQTKEAEAPAPAPSEIRLGIALLQVTFEAEVTTGVVNDQKRSIRVVVRVVTGGRTRLSHQIEARFQLHRPSSPSLASSDRLPPSAATSAAS